MKKAILIILVFSFSFLNAQQETIEFNSLDSLKITADLYLINDEADTPFLLLCHQAGWSRGEYVETAKFFNELGFNCMAIDQRSGKEVNGIENLTAKRAEEMKKSTTYIDAEQDILAAIKYIENEFNIKELGLIGSSYSSSLVLKIAGDFPSRFKSVMAFSPGEYFGSLGKSETFIREHAKNITIPVFITSAKNEKKYWGVIYDVIDKSEKKVSYLPTVDGQHGSRAMWKQFEGHEDYRNAVKDFLLSVYK